MRFEAISRRFPLDDPKTLRFLAVVGLLCFAAVAGYAGAQESMKYSAAVVLLCLMVLFRKWQEPYVLAGAVLIFICAGLGNAALAEKGLTYRWHGLFLLVGIGGLRTVYERRWHMKVRPLHIGIVIWICYIIWSTFWSWDISYALPRAVAVGVMAVAVFFSLWRYLEGWPQVTLMLQSLTAMMLPVMALQFAGSESGPSLDIYGRFPGLMAHVNGLGGLTMVAVPLGVYMLLDGPVRVPWKLAGGTLAAVSMVLLFRCASRSALVGVGLALLVYLACRNPVRLLLCLILVALLFGILIGYEVDVMDVFGVERLIRPETLPTGTNRTTAWWIGWLQHRERPVWGYGFASGPFLLSETAFHNITLRLSLGRYHNTYVELLVDTGWVGTLPFLFMFGYLGCRAPVALRRHRGDIRYRRALLGLGAVAISGLAHAFFETWLFSTGGPTTLLWWALVACWMKLLLEPEHFTRTPPAREA